jgi:hypothetical protein
MPRTRISHFTFSAVPSLVSHHNNTPQRSCGYVAKRVLSLCGAGLEKCDDSTALLTDTIVVVPPVWIPLRLQCLVALLYQPSEGLVCITRLPLLAASRRLLIRSLIDTLLVELCYPLRVVLDQLVLLSVCIICFSRLIANTDRLAPPRATGYHTY